MIFQNILISAAVSTSLLLSSTTTTSAFSTTHHHYFFNAAASSSSSTSSSLLRAAESEVNFGELDGSELRIGVLRTRWNDEHVSNLVEGIKVRH
jgi:hypothetical protein